MIGKKNNKNKGYVHLYIVLVEHYNAAPILICNDVTSDVRKEMNTVAETVNQDVTEVNQNIQKNVDDVKESVQKDV